MILSVFLNYVVCLLLSKLFVWSDEQLHHGSCLSNEFELQRPTVFGLSGMNSPFGDTSLTKVFVGGLAWETQSDSLGRYFEQFGEILEAVVIADKNTGRSKGYGFVTFQDHESARRACVDPNPIIDGRMANCNLASLGRPQPVVAFVMPHAIQNMLILSCSVLQSVYNLYGSQSYFHMYPYSQMSQAFPGTQNYTALPGFAMPSNQIMQFVGPNANAMITTSVPTIAVPYPTGTPQRPQFVRPAHSSQFMQASGSDQSNG